MEEVVTLIFSTTMVVLIKCMALGVKTSLLVSYRQLIDRQKQGKNFLMCNNMPKLYAIKRMVQGEILTVMLEMVDSQIQIKLLHVILELFSRGVYVAMNQMEII